MGRMAVGLVACAVGLAGGIWNLPQAQGQQLELPAKVPSQPVEAPPQDDAERQLVVAKYHAAVQEDNAMFRAYDAGRVTLRDRVGAKRRALDAALDLKVNDPQRRLERAKAEVELCKSVEEQIQPLSDAETVGGEPFLLCRAQFERLDAELRLLRLERGPRPAGQPAPLTAEERANLLRRKPVAADPNDDLERKLVLARSNMAAKGVDAWQQGYDQGHGQCTLDEVIAAERRALAAAMDLAGDDRQFQMELLKASVAVSKRREEHVQTLFDQRDEGGEATKLYACQLARLDDELRLLRLEQSEAKRAPTNVAALTPAERANLLAGKPIKADAGDAQRKLLVARYNVTVQAVEWQANVPGAGVPEVFRVQRLALDAAWELADDDPKLKIELAKAFLEFAKATEKDAEARANKGAQGGEEYTVSRCRYERLDAELRLLRLERSPGK